MRRADLVLVVAAWTLAGAVWLVAAGYPDVPWPRGGPPAFFPMLVAAGLALFAAGILVEGRLGYTGGEGFSMAGVARVALTAAGLALVPPAMRLLGFHVTGFLVVFGTMLVAHGRNALGWRVLAVMVLVALAVAIGLHVLFVDLAGRRLPVGTLWPSLGPGR